MHQRRELVARRPKRGNDNQEYDNYKGEYLSNTVVSIVNSILGRCLWVLLPNGGHRGCALPFTVLAYRVLC